MPTDLDRSRAVCRLCGARETLPAEPGDVSRELAAFSTRHTHDGVLQVDIVLADPDEYPAPPYRAAEAGARRPQHPRHAGPVRHFRISFTRRGVADAD